MIGAQTTWRKAIRKHAVQPVVVGNWLDLRRSVKHGCGGQTVRALRGKRRGGRLATTGTFTLGPAMAPNAWLDLEKISLNMFPITTPAAASGNGKP